MHTHLGLWGSSFSLLDGSHHKLDLVLAHHFLQAFCWIDLHTAISFGNLWPLALMQTEHYLLEQHPHVVTWLVMSHSGSRQQHPGVEKLHHATYTSSESNSNVGKSDVEGSYLDKLLK